ncbi:hypothetical protein AB0N06_33085 [Streptomyces sp. NPDC051020]|uniref:hypothetical protein n=1 Tax=Streptomyces sp. NPDC051020 TaxID=3155409 RepID=UPI003418A940
MPVLLPGTTGPAIGAATCAEAECRFTAWDVCRGTRQGSRRIAGAYRVLTPCAGAWWRSKP